MAFFSPKCLPEFESSLSTWFNAMQYHLQQRQQCTAGVLAITAIYTYYSLLLMAQARDKEKAYWTDLETSELIDYLHKHRSDFAGGNPNPEIYNAAADHIATHLSQGPKKTGKMCKTKWVSVCYHR
jgi:hypothetical protein